MRSIRITLANGIGKLWFCLMFVTLLSSSRALLAQDILDISAGATAASGSYVADKDYSGGATADTATTISTTGVTNPAPEAVYQNQRYGNFTYTLPGFTAGTTYLVRLHFDEFYWTAAGKREFNVLINGTQVLTDFDIYATAGGEFKAVVEQFDAVANSSGEIVIQFVSVVDNAEINGIETETVAAAEGPYPGPSAAAIPGTVLAENYDTGGQGVAYNVTSTNGSDNAYRPQGVDLETASSPATGNDLGWTAAGQWFKYTVDVSTAGTYTVSFLVASESAVTDAFHLSNSSGTNLSGSVAVPDTGGWQTWETVTATVTLPAGTQTLTLNQDAAGWNIDSLAFAESGGGGGTEGPYPSTAAAIPGTVLAENYDTGGQGVGYNVTSTNGTDNGYRPQGVDLEIASSPATGNDLGWTAAGQWFRYTVNVSTAGSYTVSFLVASESAISDAFHLSNSSGTNLTGSVAVPDTGGWQTWTTVTATVTLPAGTQTLTLNQDAAGWNIDSMVFTSGSSGGGAESLNCSGVANISVGGVTYTPSWCLNFGGPVAAPSGTLTNWDLGNNGGWGNGELEYYCGPPGYSGNPSQCPTTFSQSTAPIYIDGNGHLVIQPIYENGEWLSGRLQTDGGVGGQTFQYGIIEASIELPNMTPEGIWPAFWGLGNNINSGVSWPTCGETDILEDWSPSVDGGAGNAGENSTIHTEETGGDGISTRYTFPSGEAADTAFHTYGQVWSENQIQYFVDNPSAPFATLTPSSLPSGDVWPFNQPIFLILNVAVGGTLGGSAPASPPGPVLVNWIRYYAPQ